LIFWQGEGRSTGRGVQYKQDSSKPVAGVMQGVNVRMQQLDCTGNRRSLQVVS